MENEKKEYCTEIIQDDNLNYDPVFDLAYKLFIKHFTDQFKNINSPNKIYTSFTFKSKSFRNYIDEFSNCYIDMLQQRSGIVKELYLLNQTARVLMRYNSDILQVPPLQFRTQIYFPNIVYLLVRFCPNARAFLQKVIKTTYNDIQRKNKSLITLYEQSIYTDKDMIKTDILYGFLGNALRKINPLSINNIWAFYKTVFSNHFFYYFKSEQKQKGSWVSFWELDDIISTYGSNTQENIYNKVLLDLQVKEYQRESPTLRQIYYNFNIFKNVITNNEFQNLFYLTQKTNGIKKENNHYKLLSFYHQVMTMSDENKRFLEEIQKLPLIYKLLKSVHLVSKNEGNTTITDASQLQGRGKQLQVAIMEELVYPFRNMMLSDETIRPILEKISFNFAQSIMSGDYISLHTLTPINFNQTSFLIQIKQFIKLCLKDVE